MKEKAIELFGVIVDELTDEQFEDLRIVIDELDEILREMK